MVHNIQATIDTMRVKQWRLNMEVRSNSLGNSYTINKSSLDDSAVLIVTEANFTRTEAAKLAEYLEKHHVVEVSFRDCIFPDNEFIEVLSKAASLQRVDLSDNPLTFEQALEILVLGSNKLTHLNLSNTVHAVRDEVRMKP